MNKKEISEIKKTLNPQKSVITRICGCYVDNEKNIRFTSKEAFHALSEEEAFKYFDIFKHTLSGTLGKNLLNVEFPLEAEKEGGKQNFLLRLRDSKLQDEELLNEYYQSIIDNYVYESNYYIVLIHGVYDIPGKSSDGSEMFDASSDVYEYILSSICPVNLEKSGLSYDAEKNAIGELIRSWIVANPSNGFLFPCFNDRNTDIHSLLYYTKSVTDIQPGLIDNIFGSEVPYSADDEKEVFNNLIVETLGEECNFETVKNIHESISEIIEENKENPDPVVLTPNDIKQIFEESDVSNEKLQVLDENLKIAQENEKPVVLTAANITNTSKFDIKTPEVTIKVRPDCADMVTTKVIEGRKCIVIEINDQVEINGINVK
jgi:hypothetical protein